MRKLSFFCALVVIFWFVVYCPTVSADNLPAGVITLTSAQTVTLFGSELQAEYQVYDGTSVTYEPCTFTYVNTVPITSQTLYTPTGQNFVGREICWYQSTTLPANNNPDYAMLKVHYSKNLTNVTYLDFAYLVYTAENTVSNVPYNTYSEYYCYNVFDGTVSNFQPCRRGSSGVDYTLFGYVETSDSFGSIGRVPTPVYYSGSAATCDLGWLYIGTAGDVSPNGVGVYSIGIITPSINSTYDVGTGSGAGSGAGSGSPSDSENLTDINSGIQSLPSRIAGLFLPSESFIEDWKGDMVDMLQDHLGGLYESIDIIEDFGAGLTEVSAIENLSVPTVNIPLLHNQTFTLGGWTIPLKVSDSGFSIVYSSIAWITDFICTVALVNTMRKKLELFLYPDSETIPE